MAIPESPPLTPEQIQQLAAALRVWAERHPAPDDPVLSFAGDEVLSPRRLASEVAEKTPNGQAFIRMVHFGVEVMPFQQIVARFAVMDGSERP